MNQPFQVSNLITSGRSVIVGSSVGNVAIFDSETVDVLRFLSWHKDKIRIMLLMPPQVEPCVCSEVPFPDQDWNEDEKGSSYGKGTASPLRKAIGCHNSPKDHTLSNNVPGPDNENRTPQTLEPESCLITSIGNGKSEYSVFMQSKEDKIKIFNREAQQKSAYKKGSRIQSDDIVLRIWRT